MTLTPDNTAAACPQTASTPGLAYLGDAVLELCVRERLVKSGMTDAGELNAAAREYVTAVAQDKALRNILPLLTEEETAVYKRGRNLSHGSIPRSANMSQYRHATGFETLFGYLYLEGENARVAELFEAAFGAEKT